MATKVFEISVVAVAVAEVNTIATALYNMRRRPVDAERLAGYTDRLALAVAALRYALMEDDPVAMMPMRNLAIHLEGLFTAAKADNVAAVRNRVEKIRELLKVCECFRK